MAAWLATISVVEWGLPTNLSRKKSHITISSYQLQEMYEILRISPDFHKQYKWNNKNQSRQYLKKFSML